MRRGACSSSPPHPVLLPEGRRDARIIRSAGSGGLSLLGERDRVRGSSAPNVLKHGFDQKLSFRPRVERVRRYAEAEPPKFAAAEDAGNRLASQTAGGKACNLRSLIGGKRRVPVKNSKHLRRARKPLPPKCVHRAADWRGRPPQKGGRACERRYPAWEAAPPPRRAPEWVQAWPLLSSAASRLA